MITQEKLSAPERPCLRPSNIPSSCEENCSKSPSIPSSAKSSRMTEDSVTNASLLACQEHPWLRRCGDTVDLCAGEAVPSPGKEDHVPSIIELSATRQAERNSGRRNRRRHVRKQRKKSSDTVYLDAIQIDLDSPTMLESRNWCLGSSNVNEDSFLTDDEAELDEEERNAERAAYLSPNSWCASMALEAGDVTSDSGFEQDWFRCGEQLAAPKQDGSDEPSDYGARHENHASRLNTSSVLSTWMRVPCVGKHPMDFSYSVKKDVHESKKGGDAPNLKSKKKRKKSKNAMRHFLASSQSEAASDSQDLICSFNTDGMKSSKGPAKWFRKSKVCKSTTKMLSSNGARALPVDCLQLPAPEGSILKRPVQSCQIKPKKKVRWASDLLQVRYFRSEPLVPSQYNTSPRRSANRISSYDLDVLLFPWQEGNHASRDTYMSYIQ